MSFAKSATLTLGCDELTLEHLMGSEGSSDLLFSLGDKLILSP